MPCKRTDITGSRYGANGIRAWSSGSPFGAQQT
jgi:hypothetical protein